MRRREFIRAIGAGSLFSALGALLPWSLFKSIGDSTPKQQADEMFTVKIEQAGQRIATFVVTNHKGLPTYPDYPEQRYADVLWVEQGYERHIIYAEGMDPLNVLSAGGKGLFRLWPEELEIYYAFYEHKHGFRPQLTSEKLHAKELFLDQRSEVKQGYERWEDYDKEIDGHWSELNGREPKNIPEHWQAELLWVIENA